MILNLTQHPATPEQLAAGVVDLPPSKRAELSMLLTFDTLPTRQDVDARATQIASLALMYVDGEEPAVMIGGAPFLMSALEVAMDHVGITVVYAFSRRESVEEALPDGTVRKNALFRHAGFVPAW